MARCFVIQPFDKGGFDKRYDAVIAPAIQDAGLEPYRVDRDPSVTIPIDEIESGIKRSEICLAEITTDNPNVWFELGFAIAVPKDVVLICSEERILAMLEKKKQISSASNISPINETEGLSQHEIVALVTVMQNSFISLSGVPAYTIKEDMNNAGFTDIAVSLALKGLEQKGMVTWQKEYDDQYDQSYRTYTMEQKGEEWLSNNEDKLVLKQEIHHQKNSDDIPF